MPQTPTAHFVSTQGADGSRRLFDAAMGAANTEQELFVMAENKGSAAAPDWAQEGAAYLAQHGQEAFDQMAREAYGLPQQHVIESNRTREGQAIEAQLRGTAEAREIRASGVGDPDTRAGQAMEAQLRGVAEARALREGIEVENTGRQGQRDNTADQDRTNDRYQDIEWRMAEAEHRADMREVQERDAAYERRDLSHEEKMQLAAAEERGREQPQNRTQERVAEAVRDVRSGNVGVTKAMSQLQQKLDDRNQDRGQERSRGGRDR